MVEVTLVRGKETHTKHQKLQTLRQWRMSVRYISMVCHEEGLNLSLLMLR